MATNNIAPYATGVGANVLSDAAFQSLPARFTGLQAGRAPSAVFNKPMRMGSVALAVLGQIVADFGGVDANDDGNVTGFRDNLRSALAMMLSGVAYATDTSSTANVLVITLDPAPVSLTSFRQVYVRVANTNTGPATIAVNALGSRNITRQSGLPLQPGDLIAGQIVHLLYNPALGQFSLSSLASNEVAQVVSNPILYVRTDGSDANDGSANTAAKAFATVAGAAARVAAKFGSANTTITIQIGTPGTYSMPGLIPATLGTLVIQGDPNNQGAYILSGAGPGAGGTACVNCNGGIVQLVGLTIANTGVINHTVAHGRGGSLRLQNVTLTSTSSGAYSHIAATPGGAIFVGGGCIISGSMTAALLASVGSITLESSTTLTVSGSPSYSAAFAYASTLGAIFTGTGSSVSGAANGVRYSAQYNGVIGTSGGGTNFFPGSSAGTTATGGQYF